MTFSTSINTCEASEVTGTSSSLSVWPFVKMTVSSLLCDSSGFLKDKYHKIPKYSDTQKIAVIILEFEQCGSTVG